jgi:esterase/lipase
MNLIKKILFTLLILISLIGIVYYFGPKPTFKPIDFKSPKVNESLAVLDSIIGAEEAKVKDIKPNNEARIVWANDKKEKTPYSVVYLHGFSASQMEGHPVHIDFAKRYGCNLYLPRLAEHGRVDTNAFQNLTPDNLFESAQKALEIGRKLGDKVILMSCSTGGTLSIMLAKDNPDIHGYIMYSPNIDIKDPTSTLVTEQWGPEITSIVMGSDYNRISYTPEAQKYWNAVYHINGIIVTKRLIKDFMTPEYFANVKQPLLMSYYYKNETENDDVVSVPRMLEFFDQIGTQASKKRKIAYDDITRHVICSDVMTDKTQKVKDDTYKFAEEVLGMKPMFK